MSIFDFQRSALWRLNWSFWSNETERESVPVQPAETTEDQADPYLAYAVAQAAGRRAGLYPADSGETG